MESLFDRITVVAVKPEIQKERLMKRNGFASDEADRRIASQLAMEKKIAGAHDVIHNDGTLEDLERAVENYLKTLPSPNEPQAR